jgi:hypothetical protein
MALTQSTVIGLGFGASKMQIRRNQVEIKSKSWGVNVEIGFGPSRFRL